MEQGKPIFLRHLEIYQIQTILSKRGKNMDWYIIKKLDADTNSKFNINKPETRATEKTVFLRQREIDHVLHHLHLNRTEYSLKIMQQIVEQTGMPYIISSGCFTD
jgi:hypothetical protein